MPLVCVFNGVGKKCVRLGNSLDKRALGSDVCGNCGRVCTACSMSGDIGDVGAYPLMSCAIGTG